MSVAVNSCCQLSRRLRIPIAIETYEWYEYSVRSQRFPRLHYLNCHLNHHHGRTHSLRLSTRLVPGTVSADSALNGARHSLEVFWKRFPWAELSFRRDTHSEFAQVDDICLRYGNDV